jgi:hypothetical protein
MTYFVPNGMTPACESSGMESGFPLCNGFGIVKISNKQYQKKIKEYIEIHSEIARVTTVTMHPERTQYLAN